MLVCNSIILFCIAIIFIIHSTTLICVLSIGGFLSIVASMTIYIFSMPIYIHLYPFCASLSVPVLSSHLIPPHSQISHIYLTRTSLRHIVSPIPPHHRYSSSPSCHRNTTDDSHLVIPHSHHHPSSPSLPTATSPTT